MGKKYVSKRNEGKKYKEADLSNAVRMTISGKSMRSVARQYSIPIGTLHRRIQLFKMKKIKLSDDKPARIRTATFTDEQEDELIDYVNTVMEHKGGLIIKDLRKLIYEFADQNGITHRFSEKTQMAGEHFVQKFMERHPNFVLKRKENTIKKKERINGKTRVENYFSSLDKALLTHMFEPHDIFHCGQLPLKCINVVFSSINNEDEIDNPTNKPKIVTVICCANSVGYSIPPVFSFPRSNMKESLLDHAPLGSIGFATENGTVEEFVILRFLEHFVKHTRCSEKRPVLLLTSGHISPHLSEPTISQFAISNGIVTIAIPPHTLHYLHPLHKSFFIPLKKAYEAACKVWMRKHTFRNITDREVAEIFYMAYSKVLTLTNITDGFISCGVCPFNPNAELDAYKLELEEDLDEDEATFVFDSELCEPSNERLNPSSSVLFTNSEALEGVNGGVQAALHQSIGHNNEQFHNGVMDFM